MPFNPKLTEWYAAQPKVPFAIREAIRKNRRQNRQRMLALANRALNLNAPQIFRLFWCKALEFRTREGELL